MIHIHQLYTLLFWCMIKCSCFLKTLGFLTRPGFDEKIHRVQEKKEVVDIALFTINIALLCIIPHYPSKLCTPTTTPHHSIECFVVCRPALKYVKKKNSTRCNVGKNMVVV